jgi:hypothetical protein
VGVSEILAQIDQEIAHLQNARALLAGDTFAPRPKKAAKAAATKKGTAKKAVAKKKRNISPEGRKRIAEAVKRRWAKQKKAASSK